MAGTGQAMEQPQAGGGMDMAAVIALAAHVEMQVLVIGAAGVGVVVVVMVVAVELQPEGGADGEGTDDKQGDTHKEFSPGGHGLNMGEVLETDGDQGENNNTDGMTGPPGQGTATGGEGPVEGERSHCHEVVGTTDHMNGTSGYTGENADQQRLRTSVCEFCRRGILQPWIKVRRPASTSGWRMSASPTRTASAPALCTRERSARLNRPDSLTNRAF